VRRDWVCSSLSKVARPQVGIEALRLYCNIKSKDPNVPSLGAVAAKFQAIEL
jgi:hypothetical protein